jgi:hypothetical protein
MDEEPILIGDEIKISPDGNTILLRNGPIFCICHMPNKENDQLRKIELTNFTLNKYFNLKFFSNEYYSTVDVNEDKQEFTSIYRLSNGSLVA